MVDIQIVNRESKAGSVTLLINNKNESYTVYELPEKDSQLVLESRQEILNKLSIDFLVADIENVADLMFLSFNALADTVIQEKVAELQISLLDISDKCVNTLNLFSIQSQVIAKTFITVYQQLLNNQEKLAIVEFKSCAEVAKEMAKKSLELAAQIIELSDNAEIVHEEAIDIKSLSEGEKSDLKQKLAKLYENKNAAQTSQHLLERTIVDLTKEYFDSVKISQDGWFIGAVKWVTKPCTKDVQHEHEVALRQAHEAYVTESNKNHHLLIETLAEIQEYTRAMLNVDNSISEIANSVQMFHYAIRALSTIIGSLVDATMFWRTIEIYCKQLENSNFSETVNDYQNGLSREELNKEYSSPEFIALFVRSLSQWVALDNVCREYLVGAENASTKIQENIKASPSNIRAKEQTPILAKQIFESIDQQKKILKARLESDKKWEKYVNIFSNKKVVE